MTAIIFLIHIKLSAPFARHIHDMGAECADRDYLGVWDLVLKPTIINGEFWSQELRSGTQTQDIA